MINKILGEKVIGFFTIIGAIATIGSFALTYKAIAADKDELSSTGVNRIREAAANIVAPSGFTVKAAVISKVPNNTDFSSGLHKPILITDKEIPFMITAIQSSSTTFRLDGKKHWMYLGSKFSIRGSGCSLWLYATEDKTSSFKMDCQ